MNSTSNHLSNPPSNHVNEYAASQCRGLCQSIADKLPREIRDTIFAFVLESKLFFIIRKIPPSSLTSLPPCEWEAQGPMCDPMRPYQYMLDARFVGRALLPEIVEMWYRVSVFQFHDRSLLLGFLGSDTWGLGMMPRDLVRRVIITVKDFSRFNRRRSAWEVVGPQTFEKPLLHELEQLFVFKASTHLSLYLSQTAVWYMRKGGRELELFVRRVRALFPVLRRLKIGGYRVSILFSSEAGFDVEEGELSEEAWAAKIMDLVADQWAKSHAILAKSGESERGSTS